MARPRRIDHDQVLTLASSGLSVRAIALEVGASPSGVGTVLTTARAAGWRPGQPADHLERDLEADLEHQGQDQGDHLEVNRARAAVRLPRVGPSVRAVLDNALRARLAAGVGDLEQARAALEATRAAVDAALAASDKRTPQGPAARGVLGHQAEGLRAF